MKTKKKTDRATVPVRIELTATCEHCGKAVVVATETNPANVELPRFPLWTVHLSPPPGTGEATFSVLACEACARKLGGPPLVAALDAAAAARVAAAEEAEARKRRAEAEAKERADARARLGADLAEVEKRLAPIRAELATLGRSSVESPIGVDPAAIGAADDRREQLEQERDRLLDESHRIRRNIEHIEHLTTTRGTR